MSQQNEAKEALCKSLEELADKIRSGKFMPQRYSTGWEPEGSSLSGDFAYRRVTVELEYIDFEDKS